MYVARIILTLIFCLMVVIGGSQALAQDGLPTLPSPDSLEVITPANADRTTELFNLNLGADFLLLDLAIAKTPLDFENSTVAIVSEQGVSIFSDITPESMPGWVGNQGLTHSLVTFNADGTRMAFVGYDASNNTNDVYVWNTETSPDEAQRLAALNMGPMRDLHYSPDGSILALSVIQGAGPTNSGILLLDANTGEQLAILPHDNAAPLAMDFSPDGSILAAVNPPNSVYLWDVANRQLLGELTTGDNSVNSHGGESIAFSPDGSTLAVGGNDGMVRLWDVVGQSVKAEWQTYPNTTTIFEVQYSPDGALLAVSGTPLFGSQPSDEDNHIQLWEVSSGQKLIALEGHTTQVTGIAFSLDGKLMHSIGADGTWRLWGITQ